MGMESSFEKFGEAVGNKGRALAGKARDMADVMKLKSQISTCEDMIKKNYMEIGKLYYEQYGDNPEALFTNQCMKINNAKASIVCLEEEIKIIKSV